MIETDIRELNERIQRESQFIDLINLEMSKVIVGAMYCKKPTIYNGTSLAQLVNSKRGTAVTTPENIKRLIISQPHFS